MEIETVCAADMLPVRAHEADAGADLKAARDVAIRRGDTAKVSTGVRVSIPEGCFGLLAARSSLCGRGLIRGGAVMEKTIFHFVENLISGTVTVDGNWLETGVRDFVEKYQTFSVDGRKTMLVNMDYVAYVEVIESCE